MILLKRNTLLFGLVGLASISLRGMERAVVPINVFDQIQQEHTCAIDDSKQQHEIFSFKEKNEDGTPYDPTPEEFIRHGFEMQLFQPLGARFSKACELLKVSGHFPQTYEHLQMDGPTRDNLKIFRGPPRARDANEGEKPSEFDCLVNKVDCTFASAGKAVLCSQLARPPTSDADLNARNSKINTLLTLPRDPQNRRSLTPNFNTLEAHLKNAAAGESMFLSFFDPNDGFADFIRRSKTKLPLAKKVALIKKFETWLNDNQLYLYIQEATPILMSVPNILWSGATEIFNFGKLLCPNECRKFLEGLGFVDARPIIGNTPAKLQLKMQSPNLFIKFFKLAFGAKSIADLADMRQIISYMIDYNLTNIKYMRKKLHHTNKFILTLKDTQTTLQQLRAQPNGQMLVDLQLPQSDKAKETMELLGNPTFTEDHDNLCFKGRELVHWGKIKLAYKRMSETRYEFIKPYAALAELDYLMGSARLIINNPAPLIRDSTQKAKYCLPTFIRDAQTPRLQGTNCWNPFIKEGQRVVLNDVELGSDGKKMLIITGPNGQGKTVYMTMILYAALMSQALGVTTAQQFSQTPYHHLITFMNAETDTSKGESLFVNICKRAKVCKNIIKNKPGFILFAADELFNGTKRPLAEAAVYEYLKPIGTHPNVNGMTTTHLKSATRLPATYQLQFMNVKVDKHRVEPGIGYSEDEAEGLQILAEQLGQEFADAVKKNIHYQAVHEYLENQTNLDRLVQEARQEHNALRQQVGVPTLDGMVANLTDPRLRADWEQAINNPSIAEIHKIIQRLRHPNFDNFFDLLERAAVVSSAHPDTQQQTFKDLMLTIMAHCADATATAHSAPWLTRIQQVEARIAGEHERRAKLQQEINALLFVRNEEPLEQQLQTEKCTLTTLTQKKQDKVEEINDIECELNLMQRLRQLQLALEEQDREFLDAIEQTRAQLQPLKAQVNLTGESLVNN